MQSLVYAKGRILQQMTPTDIATNFLMPAVFQHVWRMPEYGARTGTWHLAFRPYVESFWHREGNNFIFQGNPNFLVRSREPLAPFVSGDARDGAFKGAVSPARDYHPRDLQMFERSFDQIYISPGYKQYCKSKYVHTLVIVDKTSADHEQRVAKGLRFLYAQLHAELLKEHHYTLDLHKKIEHPCSGKRARGIRPDRARVSQAMVTDGRRFTFVCLQMHSTAPELDSSPNLVWASKDMRLYSRSDEHGIHQLNEDVIRLVAGMMLHLPSLDESGEWLEKKMPASAWRGKAPRQHLYI